jgi:hypothetical protein
MNWRYDDFNKIRMLYFEDLKNNRQHVTVHDQRMMNDLMEKGRFINKNVRSLNINKCTILLELRNNLTERFKINVTQ